MLEKIVLPAERLILKSLGVNFVSMNYVDDVLKGIVEKVHDDRRNFSPELVVGIKRAGVYAARNLAKGLHLQTDFVEANRDEISLGGLNFNDRFIMNRFLGIYTTKNPILRESTERKILPKNILLVDDDCGSGKTFELVKKHLIERGVKNIKTACVFSYESCYQSDYVGLVIPKLNRLMKGSRRLPWNDVSPHNSEYQRRLSL